MAFEPRLVALAAVAFLLAADAEASAGIEGRFSLPSSSLSACEAVGAAGETKGTALSVAWETREGGVTVGGRSYDSAELSSLAPFFTPFGDGSALGRAAAPLVAAAAVQKDVAAALGAGAGAVHVSHLRRGGHTVAVEFVAEAASDEAAAAMLDKYDGGTSLGGGAVTRDAVPAGARLAAVEACGAGRYAEEGRCDPDDDALLGIGVAGVAAAGAAVGVLAAAATAVLVVRRRRRQGYLWGSGENGDENKTAATGHEASRSKSLEEQRLSKESLYLVGRDEDADDLVLGGLRASASQDSVSSAASSHCGGHISRQASDEFCRPKISVVVRKGAGYGSVPAHDDDSDEEDYSALISSARTPRGISARVRQQARDGGWSLGRSEQVHRHVDSEDDEDSFSGEEAAAAKSECSLFEAVDEPESCEEEADEPIGFAAVMEPPSPRAFAVEPPSPRPLAEEPPSPRAFAVEPTSPRPMKEADPPFPNPVDVAEPPSPRVFAVEPPSPRPFAAEPPSPRPAALAEPPSPRAFAVEPPSPRAFAVEPPSPRPFAAEPPSPRPAALAEPPSPRAFAVEPPSPRPFAAEPPSPRPATLAEPPSPRAFAVEPSSPRPFAAEPPSPRPATLAEPPSPRAFAAEPSSPRPFSAEPPSPRPFAAEPPSPRPAFEAEPPSPRPHGDSGTSRASAFAISPPGSQTTQPAAAPAPLKTKKKKRFGGLKIDTTPLAERPKARVQAVVPAPSDAADGVALQINVGGTAATAAAVAAAAAAPAPRPTALAVPGKKANTAAGHGRSASGASNATSNASSGAFLAASGEGLIEALDDRRGADPFLAAEIFSPRPAAASSADGSGADFLKPGGDGRAAEPLTPMTPQSPMSSALSSLRDHSPSEPASPRPAGDAHQYPPPPDSPMPAAPESPEERGERELQARLLEGTARELLDTERTFCDSMRAVVQHYAEPLGDLGRSSGHLLGDAERAALLGGISEMAGSCSSLLHAPGTGLVAALAAWDPDSPATQRLGAVFVEHASHAALLRRYAEGLETSLAALVRLLDTNRKFEDFCEERRRVAAAGGSGGAPLHSLLVAPLQRAERVRALLARAERHAGASHPDAAALQQARSMMDVVCAGTAHHAERGNQLMVVWHVSRQLANGRELGLARPGRVFVRRGTLTKVCRRRNKAYEFLLFSDRLVYAERTFRGRLRANRTLTVDSRFEAEELAPQILTHGIRVAAPEKSFHVIAASRAEQGEWCRALQACAAGRAEPVALPASPSTVVAQSGRASAAAAAGAAPSMVRTTSLSDTELEHQHVEEREDALGRVRESQSAYPFRNSGLDRAAREQETSVALSHLPLAERLQRRRQLRRAESQAKFSTVRE